MRPIQSRLLAATAIVVVATITLGACAQAQPDEASAPVLLKSAPGEIAAPAPASSPGGDSQSEPGTAGTATPPQTGQRSVEGTALVEPVELVDFETRNGTMRMRIPAGWTIDDMGAVGSREDGTQGWQNNVGFNGPDGSRLFYTDTVASSTPHTVWGDVVDERPLTHAGTVTARVWESPEGNHFVYVDTGTFLVDDFGPSLHSLHFGYPDTMFDTRAEAEAFVASAPVQLALDVMQTLEIVGARDALPEGIGVEHEGTTYLPYTTQNGTASFLVPQHWRIEDHSRRGTNRAGQEVWDNSVALYLPNGNMVLHYGDMWFTNLIEEWEWTLGEVRPTQTDGWQAVSWTLGDSVPHHAGYVGVSLTDQGGAVRPADNVCTENLCRSFSSIPHSVRWLDDGLDGPEDFFGSAIEEQLLTAVASLETHHDDATRMPW